MWHLLFVLSSAEYLFHVKCVWLVCGEPVWLSVSCKMVHSVEHSGVFDHSSQYRLCFFSVWKVFLNKHFHFRDIYPLHSITDWGKCSARRFFCSDSWNNSKNNTSRHSLLRNSGGRLWIRGEMILNSLKAGSSSRPLCMINRNQIPLLTIRSALFCFHLPPSSALLSLWNPLYLAVPPTPHPAVSACPRFTAPPPLHLSHCLECRHSPTLFSSVCC